MKTNQSNEMQVTSIRLEKSLKDALKSLSDEQGYQSLIRETLWNYVNRQEGNEVVSEGLIRFTVKSVARKDEFCALTGKPINAGQSMLLGLDIFGHFCPISLDALR